VNYSGYEGTIAVDGSRIADVVHWTVVTGSRSWKAVVDIKGDADAIGAFMVELPELQLECWNNECKVSGNALTHRAEIHRNRLHLLGNGRPDISETHQHAV
jgi:hypothetical protein